MYYNLSQETAERIVMLAEEASEVVQICCKILRYGIASYHPGTLVSNNQALLSEIRDFMAVASQVLPQDMGLDMPNESEIKATWELKRRWTNHQDKK